MKKFIMFGAVGVLALAMGTTTLASGYFWKKAGKLENHPVCAAAFSTAGTASAPVRTTASPQEAVMNEREAVPAEDAAPSAAPAGNVCVFTDEDHDGYCDYGDIHEHSGDHRDRNYDGFCDEGDHFCMNYYDADCDGICDNCHDAAMHGGAHHNFDYGNGGSGNYGGTYEYGDSGNAGYGYHHSERHGMGRHHR